MKTNLKATDDDVLDRKILSSASSVDSWIWQNGWIKKLRYSPQPNE
jgi:hypothetical protein